MEAGDSKICSVGQQAWYAGELMVQMKSESILLENSLLFSKGTLFVLFTPSDEWMKPTHIMESNLLYPKFTDLTVNLTQKYPPDW